MQSERPNLSGLIAERVREQILEGTLDAAARINEVHLAETLAVSRTPLREALTRLVAEGLLIAAPRRGYFVRPLDAEEVPDLYAMRALLDPAALLAAGAPPIEQLTTLANLNDEIRACGEVRAMIALDDRWHLELLSHCTNRFLLEEIRRFMALTLRYELAYFRHAGGQDVATDEHEVILSALGAQDLEGACRALVRNLTSAIDPIVEWLSS